MSAEAARTSNACAPAALPRRSLGACGLETAVLGFGTIKLGRDRGMKYPAAYTLPDDETAAALLDLCREAGVDLLDTAPAYGTSEARLGELLARRGDRDAWLLSTKAGESFDGERSVFDFSPEHVVSSLDRSLSWLRTDRVEIVLVHSDGVAETELERLGTLDALDELKAAGKTRAVGVSPKTAEGLRLALRRSDVVMVAHSAAEHPFTGLIAEAGRAGVGVMVKKGLASGHLNRIAGADPVGEATRFVLGTEGVTTMVVGTLDPRHLRQNIAAAAAACGVGAAAR